MELNIGKSLLIKYFYFYRLLPRHVPFFCKASIVHIRLARYRS